VLERESDCAANLVVDEPTTGVDAVSRREFWDLLAQLKASGLPIVVSTPYMDEANRCDRVALLHKGRILDVDTPAAISARYPLPLLAVRADERYRLIRVLRAFPHAYAVHPFGEDVHYTDVRRGAEPTAIAEELHGYLRRERFEDATVKPIPADIEDTFMALMGEGGRGKGEGGEHD
jgi:ABC-2 type transport system ATP-binding protein